MNSNQIANLLTSILQPLLGLLVAHGWFNNDDAATIGGAVGILITFLISHIWHSEPPAAPPTVGKLSLLALLILPALFFTGCAGSVSSKAFTAEQAAASTSDAAMRGYATYWQQAEANPVAFNRTTNGLASERAAVESAAIQVGASIELTEDLRESYATNSAVEPQLQAAVSALVQNTGNIITYVGGLIAINTNNATQSK